MSAVSAVSAKCLLADSGKNGQNSELVARSKLGADAHVAGDGK
jgi:hypothetical protein